MNRPLLLCSAALLLGATFSPSAQADAGFALKNRSAFSAHNTSRDPFWPIGWKKGVHQQATASVVVASLKPADFVISSIVIDSATPLAVINGKIYGQGDAISMQVDGAKVDVKVAAIADGSVQLVYRGGSITAPLRRK